MKYREIAEALLAGKHIEHKATGEFGFLNEQGDLQWFDNLGSFTGYAVTDPNVRIKPEATWYNQGDFEPRWCKVLDCGELIFAVFIVSWTKEEAFLDIEGDQFDEVVPLTNLGVL